MRRFQFSGLEIHFRDNRHIGRLKPKPLDSADKPNPEDIDKSHQLIEVAQEEAFLAETVRDREDELSDLLITDPEKYEDLVISGDLVDAKDDK